MNRNHMNGNSRIPAVGAPVSTRDGKSLGSVKEVAGDYFKVDAPMEGDYWLSSEFVVASNSTHTEVDFDEQTLEDYKLDQPGPAFVESPALDEETETFSSLEEKGQRREQMERGYGPR